MQTGGWYGVECPTFIFIEHAFSSVYGPKFWTDCNKIMYTHYLDGNFNQVWK